MVQIIKNPNSELGAILGRNLSTGLSALANQKLGELHQRQQAQGFQSLGQLVNKELTPEQAENISRLSPQIQQQIVKGLTNPRQPLINQQIALTPVQQGLQDKYQNYEKIIQAADDAIDLLESDKVELGPYGRFGEAFSPERLLNNETQAFLGDATNIINLRGENLKGLMSKHRQQRLEKDKISLDFGKEENLRRAKRIKQEAEHGIKQLKTGYPDQKFISILDEINQNPVKNNLKEGSEIDELPQPGTPEFEQLPENASFESDGIIFYKKGNSYAKKRAKE